jgi:hypothetical protein
MIYNVEYIKNNNIRLFNEYNKEILNVIEIDKKMKSYKVIIDGEVREFILTKQHTYELDPNHPDYPHKENYEMWKMGLYDDD